MRNLKRIVSLALAGLTALSVPLQASAATPEFARSAEEWERLRDDKIEYDELSDLIHEYNATVRKNQIDLNEFRKDYGETNDEWSDRYRELADDLESSLDYPDVDDSGYASAMTNIVTSEIQIDNWRETADDSLEDYMVYYYNYCLAEKLLVSTAQSNMINYYLNQLQLQTDQKQVEVLQETYQSAVNQRAVGRATDVDVLTARENLRNAEKAVQDDQSAIDTGRRYLIVLLGWNSEANPEIGEIPEVDLERIASMDPAADKAAAVENSYTMKANKRKLENARSTDKIEDLNETIQEDEQNIGASLNASYQNVISCQAAYELAEAQAALEEENLRKIERKYGQGSASHLEYVTQQYTTEKAQINVEVTRLNLFQAIESYDWAVNGLADTDSNS